MLLFLLSLYLNYNLLNCEKNESDGIQTSSPVLRSGVPLYSIHYKDRFSGQLGSIVYPGHPLRPLHSLYIGVRPLKYKNQNVFPDRPGRFVLNEEQQQGGTTPRQGANLLWPVMPLKKDGSTGMTEQTSFSYVPDLIHTGTPPPPFSEYNMEITTEPIPESTPPSAYQEDMGSTTRITLPYLNFETSPADEAETVLLTTVPPGKIFTTAGDVLYGHYTSPSPSTISPKQRYLDLMDELKEGYLMIFVLEFTKLISIKNVADVEDVLLHAQMIYTRLLDTNQLEWVHHPLQDVIWKVSMMMSNVRNMDTIKTYAAMLFHLLMQRRLELSDEVNDIIDEADLFYNDSEGDRLFSALKEFEDYPKNTTKTGYYLCDSIMQAVLNPFKRLAGTNRRRRLLDRINSALEKRFPKLRLKKNSTLVYEGRINPYRKANEGRADKDKQNELRINQVGYNSESAYLKHYSNPYNNYVIRARTGAEADLGADKQSSGLFTQSPTPMK